MDRRKLNKKPEFEVTIIYDPEIEMNVLKHKREMRPLTITAGDKQVCGMVADCYVDFINNEMTIRLFNTHLGIH